MTTSVPNTDIIIKRHPFQSPACFRLISALDEEVEALYPDHDEFPYDGPGGWAGALAQLNPVPANPEAAVNGAPDAQEPSRDSTAGHEQEVVWENEDPAVMARAEEKGELFFFVAFAGSEGEDNAVGCVGIVLLPYFPLHHAPREGEEEGVGERGREPVTAEIKRMYIAPEYRGQQQGEEGQSLAVRLLRRAEVFARQEMGVQRLVLETGMRQYAAMKLYQREGWVKRREYGDYVGAGEESGGISRCYEKWL